MVECVSRRTDWTTEDRERARNVSRKKKNCVHKEDYEFINLWLSRRDEDKELEIAHKGVVSFSNCTFMIIMMMVAHGRETKYIIHLINSGWREIAQVAHHQHTRLQSLLHLAKQCQWASGVFGTTSLHHSTEKVVDVAPRHIYFFGDSWTFPLIAMFSGGKCKKRYTGGVTVGK